MYFCYLDESGTPESAGTSHFVLVGLAIPSSQWKSLEKRIFQIKSVYGLQEAEVHTAWMLRRYVEQERIADFELLDRKNRIQQVQLKRDAHLLRLAATGTKKQLKAAKVNYRKTREYVHLTLDQRRQLVRELADCIGGWSDARLFAQAVDISYLATLPPRSQPPFEYAFTEIVQRFEYFLVNRGRALNQDLRGILIQDNNQTVALKITRMMRQFHRLGTKWTSINHIVETPFFVDSQLTSMVQMSDLCGYAIRRYLENNETDLFDRIFDRFDRTPQGVVGIHHFGSPGCSCRICQK